MNKETEKKNEEKEKIKNNKPTIQKEEIKNQIFKPFCYLEENGGDYKWD